MTNIMNNGMTEATTGTTSNAGEQTPNARQHYEIDAAQLPLHCPLPAMSLWNSHPKVYLPVEETGQAKCPYCGAEFRLKNGLKPPAT